MDKAARVNAIICVQGKILARGRARALPAQNASERKPEEPAEQPNLNREASPAPALNRGTGEVF